MRRALLIITRLALLVLPWRSSPATEVAIALPAETAAYKPAAGVELAQSFCIQCHSADYTAIQPPMPAKFWEAEVKKMREKYFAPLPAEMDARLVEYLVQAYGTADAVK